MAALVVSAALILAVVQGLGVLVVHPHVAFTPDHAHRYIAHGDEHPGHAEDVVESSGPHAGLLSGRQTTSAEALPVPAVAIIIALLIGALVIEVGPWRWRTFGHRRPPRRRLALLNVLVV